jgi:oligoribonuclease NrnB/cAMP/cGMP phosphodiesterase (DHH superfamily)
MNPLVIYHANCTDGFGAAYAAWAKLGDDAEYLPMHYNQKLDPSKVQYEDRDVYVLDFSFDRETTERLLDAASQFIWLDHHKTAFEMWCPKHEHEKFVQTEAIPRSGAKPVGCHITLDNNKSGALLAWEYFHPGADVPELAKLIDDRDRWQFKLGGSREFHAGVNMRPFSFREWHLLTPLGTSDSGRNLADVMGKGRAALEVYRKQTMESAAKAKPCSVPHPDVGGYEHNPWEWSDGGFWHAPGLAVNTPNNISEVGHELATASGTYGLVWYYDGSTGKANCSLRSEGDYDVSAIARCFGGGGHKNAAGFQIDMPTLLGWVK